MGIARLVQFLLELSKAKFYGTVMIQFREGEIRAVKREETWPGIDSLPVNDLEAVRTMETGGRLKVAAG